MKYFVSNDEFMSRYSVHETMRLDLFLKEQFQTRSRHGLQQAIYTGRIQVLREQLLCGKIKPSLKLLPGDQVCILSVKKKEAEVNFNFTLLFEDEDLFVIDKPAPLPVHPAGSYFFNTLLSHLQSNFKGEFFLCHRIDKETSGVLVLAKNKKACAALSKEFAMRLSQKTYFAIVHGNPPPQMVADFPLARSKTSRIALKMEVSPSGAPALTRFKTRGIFKNFALLECSPQTGRQHQIRVHCEALGYPIVGDKLYGIAEDESLQFYEKQCFSEAAQEYLILPRHALHAFRLTITHPTTQKKMSFQAKLPSDLRSFLRGTR